VLTILYFAATSKYQCPSCKSTSIEILNKKGVYAAQRRPMVAVLWVLVGIAVIGVFTSIILAALNNARENVSEQNMQSTNRLSY
jgi:hypothetical protein